MLKDVEYFLERGRVSLISRTNVQILAVGRIHIRGREKAPKQGLPWEINLPVIGVTCDAFHQMPQTPDLFSQPLPRHRGTPRLAEPHWRLGMSLASQVDPATCRGSPSA